jgi:hypothetical protein
LGSKLLHKAHMLPLPQHFSQIKLISRKIN